MSPIREPAPQARQFPETTCFSRVVSQLWPDPAVGSPLSRHSDSAIRRSPSVETQRHSQQDLPILMGMRLFGGDTWSFTQQAWPPYMQRMGGPFTSQSSHYENSIVWLWKDGPHDRAGRTNAR